MPKESQQELITLAVEDGVEHILDLSTGQQIAEMPKALRDLRRIAERSVNKAKIEAVLRAAGIASYRDEEDDLVAIVFGEEVHIIITPDSTLLRLLLLRALKPFVPEAALNESLRLANLEAYVVRIRSANDGLVCADYAMSYQYGVSPQQMVGMLRGFAWTVQQMFAHGEIAGLLEAEL